MYSDAFAFYVFPILWRATMDRYIKGGKERGKLEFQTGFSVLKSPSQVAENVAFLIYFFKSFPTVYESSRSDKNWPAQISRKSSGKLSDQVEKHRKTPQATENRHFRDFQLGKPKMVLNVP
jgi:hypothetical protein